MVEVDHNPVNRDFEGFESRMVDESLRKQAAVTVHDLEHFPPVVVAKHLVVKVLQKHDAGLRVERPFIILFEKGDGGIVFRIGLESGGRKSALGKRQKMLRRTFAGADQYDILHPRFPSAISGIGKAFLQIKFVALERKHIRAIRHYHLIHAGIVEQENGILGLGRRRDPKSEIKVMGENLLQQALGVFFPVTIPPLNSGIRDSRGDVADNGHATHLGRITYNVLHCVVNLFS